jgi:hypothetical protein
MNKNNSQFTIHNSQFSFKKLLLIFLIVHCALYIVHPCFAQEHLKKEEDNSDDRSLIVSTEYASDRVVYGRKLSTALPNIAPSLSYEAPSGFYTNLTIYRLLQPVQKIYETDWNTGWDFTVTKKLKAGVGYTRFFYSKDTSLQQFQFRSTLVNQFELNLTLETKVITAKLYFDYLFGSGSSDVILPLDLSHKFKFENPFTEDNDELLIEPTASIYLGTNNYVSLYKKGRGKGVSEVNNTKFGYQGIEFALPVEYDIGKFIFTASGHYNIPQAQSISVPSKIHLSQSALDQINSLTTSTPTFYFTFSVGFSII